MSTIGIFSRREVNGEFHEVEVVTVYMGIYKNPISGFWCAIDWKHKARAAFREIEIGRKWCQTANEVYAGLPETNADYEVFNAAMKARGWRVVQLLGDCQVWEKGAPS